VRKQTLALFTLYCWGNEGRELGVVEKYDMDGGYKNFIENVSDEKLFKRYKFPKQK
jgi:hypothetical protein